MREKAVVGLGKSGLFILGDLTRSFSHLTCSFSDLEFSNSEFLAFGVSSPTQRVHLSQIAAK